MPSQNQSDELIRRAYINLKAVKANMPTPSGIYVDEEELFKMFNRSLDQLQQAGVDVSEWRMPSDAAGNISGNEFLAKIDAVLMYFAIEQENAQIGFHR